MPRKLIYVIALALGALAVLALSACGEDDAQLLPGSTAGEINANLDTVKRLSGEGDCIGAESAAQQVSEQIESLDGIDPELKQALRRGAARLNEVVAECEEEETEAISPAEIPAEEEATDEDRRDRKDGKDDDEEEDGEDDRGDSGDEEPEEEGTAPSLPPQAQGEAKGHEGEAPSGGVGPGSPVGEAEE